MKTLDIKKLSKVLVIEDIYESAMYLFELLEAHKWQAEIAYNGTTGLLLAEKEDISLILLDINLPDIDGFEICKRLKNNATTKDKPILFLTAQTDYESINKAFHIGGSDYITKPFSGYQVLARIEVHLQNYHLIKKLKETNQQLDAANKNMIYLSADLMKSEQELKLITENAPELIIELDQIGKIIYSNKKNQNQLYENFINTFYSQTKNKCYYTFFQHFDNVIKTGKQTSFHFCLSNKTGQNITCFAGISPVYMEGEVKRVIVVLQDITEIENANSALKESELKYRQLTDNLTDIVWKTDLNGNIIYVNIAFSEIFGFDNDNEQFKNFSQIFSFSAFQNIVDELANELENYQISKANAVKRIFQLLGQNVQKEELYLETTADFVFDKNGKTIAIQGVMRDVTQRKKDEFELELYRKNLEKLVTERTKELKDKNEHLQLIFDNAPATMMLVNPNHEILKINKTGVHFTNSENEKLLQKKFGSAINCVNSFKNEEGCGFSTECEDCILRNATQNTIQSRTNFTKMPANLVLKQGENEQHYLVNVSSAFSGTQNENSVLLTIDDVTSQKKAEHDLLESEEKYRKLFETKNEAVLILDSETFIYFEVNSAACALYGYERKELLTMSPFDISMQVEDTKLNLKKLKAEEKNMFIKQRLCKRKNGEQILVEINNSIINLRNRRVIYSTHRDITQQQRAIQELKKSEETFRGLVESINEIFLIINTKSGEILYVSPQFERLTGYTSDEFMKQDVFNLPGIHPADFEHIQQKRKEVANLQKFVIDFRLVKKNNEIRWFKLNAFNYIRTENNINHLYAIAADVTEQKNTERKILKAILETENREREQFAKELHDGLGANLSAIKMYMERLGSNELTAERQQFYISQVQELIQKASTTSREISHNLKPHILKNHGLISSIETLCNDINVLGKIHIQFNALQQKWQLSEDEELAIYRIVSELVNNSLKYSFAKNALIEMKMKDEKFQLFYGDNGKGFDAENIMKKEGTGLKNIKARVNSLGGDLNITSQINFGMNVHIEFPLNKL